MITSTCIGQLSRPQQQAISANTEFGFRLVKNLALKQPQTDVFVSPFSVASVLQMLSNGARGQTQQELRDLLDTASLSAEQANSAYAQAAHSLTAQTNSVINIANALWYRAGARLNSGFANVNQQFYHAQLSPLDFALPESAQLINDWANRATFGKIPQIISPPIAPNTGMILASAIYFKGSWQDQFNSSQTKPRAFHSADGKQVTVPMMHQTQSWLYLEREGYQAIQLPYAGGTLAMQLLLPATNSDLQLLLSRVDANIWEKEILAGLRHQRGSLVLPRFSLRYATDLKQPLNTMGLTSAFGPGADFSGISSHPLYVSQLKHQSFVEVNEQGTEAAAVTTGVVALTSVREPRSPFQMVVDRPFLFAISDLPSRSVLFVGIVYHPAPNG